MPVSTTRLCPDCGAALSGGTLAGLCPACLFQSGVDEVDRMAPAGVREGAVEGEPFPPVGPRFGEYELLREIARGGMGVVYQARQPGLKRIVALKLIVGGPWAGHVLRERFVLEARTAAALTHPHIIPVYDFGEHAGHAYLSMHFAEGGSLADALAAGRWPQPPADRFPAIAGFLRDVAGAVHHAHQRGVLHRDLKPSNILLDEQFRPLVADFGLAKLRDVSSSLTHSSALLGTPAYMAPEQAAGKATEVTTAADIYSLGAVLYELLTGRPPFVGASPLQTIQQVARYELVPPNRLNAAVPRDLMVICLKCLRWKPEDRYASAGDLADDLGRYLNRQPIRARTITPVQRAAYWVRRRPLVAGLSALLATLLVLSAVLGTVQALRLQRANATAVQLADESRARLSRMYLKRWEQEIEAGSSLRSLPALFESLRLLPNDPRTRQLHARRLDSVLSRSPSLERMWFLGSMVERLSIRPDGAQIAAGQYGGHVHVWDAATGELAFPVIDHAAHLGGSPRAAGEFLYLWNVEFSPDGRHLLTACNNDVLLWETTGGSRVLGPIHHAKKVWQTAFVPAGDSFATACLDGQARIFRVADGAPIFETPPQAAGLLAVAFSPDGRFLATGDRAGQARLWSVAGERELRRPLPHEGEVRQVVFHPRLPLLATASRDATARLWNWETGDITILTHQRTVNSVAFSPDGSFLATASADGGTRLWRVADGKLAMSDHRGSQPINRVLFDPAGERFVSIGDDGEARSWRLADGAAEPWAIPHNHHLTDAAFVAGQPHLVTASADGVVKLSRLPVAPVDAAHSPAPLWFGPDWEIAPAGEGRIALRQGGRPRHEVAFAGRLVRAQSDPALRRIFLVDEAQHSFVWKLETSQLLPFRWSDDPCSAVAAFGIDGRSLLVNSAMNEVARWNLETDAVAFRARHERAINHAAISPDGRWFATASDDPGARLWRYADGQPQSPVLTHPDFVRLVAFSPDASLLASAGLDGQVRLWKVPDGRPWQKPLVHPDPVEQLIFGPSGEYLATVTTVNELRVWRIADAALLTPAWGHRSPVRRVEFSPDSRLIRTTTTAGFHRLWELESAVALTLPTPLDAAGVAEPFWRTDIGQPADLARLEAEVHLLSGARIGRGGDFEYLDTATLQALWSARGKSTQAAR